MDGKDKKVSVDMNKRMKSYFELAVLGLFIALINSQLTCCACGHLSFISLLGSLIGAALAWVAFFKHNEQSWIKRLVMYIALILTTLLIIKTSADILWCGHTPLIIR